MSKTTRRHQKGHATSGVNVCFTYQSSNLSTTHNLRLLPFIAIKSDLLVSSLNWTLALLQALIMRKYMFLANYRNTISFMFSVLQPGNPAKFRWVSE